MTTTYRPICLGCGKLPATHGPLCRECAEAAEWAAQFKGYHPHEREQERMRRDEQEHARIR